MLPGKIATLLVIATVLSVIGALLGFYIGQHFNGTVVPLTLGFSLCGIAALVVVLIVEKGRLFHPAPGRS